MANPLSVIKALEGASEAVGAAKKGIRAYHGSPYKFDKFDASKIGTGEGAQAYGHGLYFAENEGTAGAYKNALKDRVYETSNGPVKSGQLWQSLVNETTGVHPDIARGVATNILDGIDETGNANKFAQEYNFPEVYKKALAKAQELGIKKNPGHMYEVNIGADPSHFLDWDKPLSEQPQAVKELIRDELKAKHYLGLDDNEPQQLESAIRSWKMGRAPLRVTPLKLILTGRGNLVGGTPAEVAKKFNSTGIPGVKYLDQGSRGAGAGTSNYVVFNPDIIEILRRYNRGGFAVKR